MKKIYIVDAVNFLFRSYYAIGPMTNSVGESTNALYGFIRSIYKLIRELSPTHFIAVFDGKESKKSRTAIYSEYKSNREKAPADLYLQLERSIGFCDIAGIPHLEIEGVEADDTIGSITKWAEKKGCEVFICSSDKDLCQLVSDHVRVINAHKDNLIIDKEKVKEIFGVTPSQIIDLLAIMGDASDNIPGLPGFGPKTAVALLSEFGSLEEILAHPEKLSGKKQETVRTGKEIARLSQRLATIDTQIPFPEQEDFFKLKSPDIEAMKSFYHEMRFLSLLKELGEEASQTPISNIASDETLLSYELIEKTDALISLIEKLQKEPELSLFAVMTGDRPMKSQLLGVALSNSPGKAWYVPLQNEQFIPLLRPLLEHPEISFISHNAKDALHALLNSGIEISSITFDTALANYLLTPHMQKQNLEEICLDKLGKKCLNLEEVIGKGKTLISVDSAPLDKLCAYGCQRADYTLRLKLFFHSELIKNDLVRVFHEIEIPLLPVLLKMERAGIYVDSEQLKEMSVELNQKLRKIEKQIYAMAEEEFNLNSPKQLSLILFEKLQIKSPKKTATGHSTAADVLESLKEEHPIIHEILTYRTLEKLRSTYVDALPLEINPHTHRIHCTFNQTVAATGRLSCQNPNLQNIPVRAEEGKKIRTAFHPQKKDYSFLSADYSQIELRLLAHLSGDPMLIAAFQAGEDIHTFTASQVFDIPLKEVSYEMRNQAKAVNFGILYGQQAFGLSQGLGMEYKEAAAFIKKYFKRYPKVEEYLENSKEIAREKGYAETMTGRRRPVPEMRNKNPMIRSAAERLAMNTPLQGTAADLIKLAMIKIALYLDAHPHLGKMLLQIHDELIFEVPDIHLAALAPPIKHLMETTMDLDVPLIVDISIGKNWGEC